MLIGGEKGWANLIKRVGLLMFSELGPTECIEALCDDEQSSKRLDGNRKATRGVKCGVYS